MSELLFTFCKFLKFDPVALTRFGILKLVMLLRLIATGSSEVEFQTQAPSSLYIIIILYGLRS